MQQFSVVSLDASTWDRFAELVERNGGIFGDAGASATIPSAGSAASATAA
jgi:hypothetical protein